MTLTEEEKQSLWYLCEAIELERDGNKAIEDIINIPDSLLNKLRDETR